MASLTSAINVNVPTEVKNEANVIFNSLGLNMSTAINMFLKKTIYERGIPFEVTLPKEDNLLNYFSKEELDKSAKELNYMEKNTDKYKSYNNINDLFKDLDSDD